MARKIEHFVSVDGRDAGKAFIITEMPARAAEKWAIRALLAMGKNGVEIPEGAFDAGMASMAKIGLGMVCKLPYDEAESLLDEMLSCVTIMPDPSKPNITRDLVEDDTEEVATLLKLRVQTFKLHVDFSKADSK
jgi:hypothetical protein